MMDSPLISVIMPLYNKRPYVNRAIDSVLSQSFPDWELIVIDDGSTDSSLDEVPKDEPRIRLLEQSNAGPGAARNRGINLARGEYVTFLDADDYYYPHKLEQEMKLLHEEKKAEWMISAFDLESNDRMLTVYILDREGKDIKEEPAVFDNAIEQLKIQFWHTNGMCIKKSLLKRIGGFNESMRWLEITEMQIRCALVQPRVLVSSVPSHRVVDVPGSASKISLHRVQGLRKMGENLHDMAKKCPSFAYMLIPRSKEHFFSYIASLIYIGNRGEARKFLKKDFPYIRDRRWWKLWAGSWLPDRVIARIARNRSSQQS